MKLKITEESLKENLVNGNKETKIEKSFKVKKKNIILRRKRGNLSFHLYNRYICILNTFIECIRLKMNYGFLVRKTSNSCCSHS